MTEKFTDELISAYLDGELTAEQQAAVENTLMDSVEHRRMFEELRALRGSLQSMPNHQLDDDFFQRVLRRAERAMLAPESNATSSDNNGESTTEKPQPTVSVSSSRRWYGIALTISTVAAGLLVALFVFTPDTNDEQNLAKVQAPPHEEFDDTDGETEEGGNRRELSDRKKNLGSLPNDEADSAPRNLSPAKATAKKPATFFGDEAKGSGGGPRGANALGAPALGQAKAQGRAGKPAMLGNATGGDDLTGWMADERLLVVTLRISPEAHRDGSLYKALHKNQIMPEPTAANETKQSTPPSDANINGFALQDQLESNVKLKGAIDNTELVLIEASLDQVQKAIDELDGRPRQLLGIEAKTLFGNGNPASLAKLLSWSEQKIAEGSQAADRLSGLRKNDPARLSQSAAGAPAARDVAKADSTTNKKLSPKKEAVGIKAEKAKAADAKEESLPADKNRSQKDAKYLGQDKEGGDHQQKLGIGTYRRVQPRAIQRQYEQQRAANQRKRKAQFDQLDSVADKDAKTNNAPAAPRTNFGAARSIAKPEQSEAETRDARRGKSQQPVRVLFVIQVVHPPAVKADAVDAKKVDKSK